MNETTQKNCYPFFSRVSTSVSRFAPFPQQIDPTRQIHGARQEKQVAEFKKEESRLLPANLDYNAIAGLRLEAREKLAEIRPMSIGQAGRVSGVSPADIAVLLIYLEQMK